MVELVNFQAWSARLAGLIGELESRSRIEIVPYLIEQRGAYKKEKWLWTVAVTVLCLLGVAIWDYVLMKNGHIRGVPWAGWMLAVWMPFLASVIVWAVAPDWSLRHLLPRWVLLANVRRRAEDVFVRERLEELTDRVGLLVAVFSVERSVLVLGCTELVEKMGGDQVVAGLGQRLAADFAAGSEGETFLEALREIGLRVAPQFPRVDRVAADAGQTRPNHLRVLRV